MENPEFTRMPVGRFEWERIMRRVVVKPPSVKLVGLVMATYASADGSRVRPGQQRLAAVMGTSVSTVERGQRELERIGFLDMIVKGHSAGRGRSGGYASEYQLTIPDDLVERVPMLDPDEQKQASHVTGDSGIHPSPMTDKWGETPVTGAESPVNSTESPVTHDGPPLHNHHYKNHNKNHQSIGVTFRDAGASETALESAEQIEANRQRQLLELERMMKEGKEAS